MFSVQITLGQLAIAGAIIGGFWRMTNILQIYKFQHGMMWEDYKLRKGLRFVPKDCPVEYLGDLDKKGS